MGSMPRIPRVKRPKQKLPPIRGGRGKRAVIEAVMAATQQYALPTRPKGEVKR